MFVGRCEKCVFGWGAKDGAEQLRAMHAYASAGTSGFVCLEMRLEMLGSSSFRTLGP